MGPSGCGKTSLMNILAGLRGASDGSICMNGREKSLSSILDDDTMGYAGNAAMVQQNDHLLGMLTVRQTLEMAARSKGVKDWQGRVDEMVAMLGLGQCEHTLIGNVFFNGISGGQRDA